MQVEVRADLGPWRTAWDELVATRPLPSPFLRSWWLEAAAGDQPVWVLVHSGGTLLGGLALERDHPLGVLRLRPLGFDLSPDHVGLVARPGREQVVAAAVADHLAGCPQLLVLPSLDDLGGLTTRLPGAVRRDTVDVLPYVTLGRSYDELLAGRSSSFRSEQRRLRRRLRDRGAIWRLVDASEVERALADLRSLHGERFGAASLLEPHRDRFERVVRAGLARGELLVHELVAGERVVASNVVLRVAGRTSGYQAARTNDPAWRGSGAVLLGYVLEHACRDGSHEMDLLRGGAPYKLRWATGQRPLVRVTAAIGERARVVERVLPVAVRARAQWRDRRPRRLARRVPSRSQPEGHA